MSVKRLSAAWAIVPVGWLACTGAPAQAPGSSAPAQKPGSSAPIQALSEIAPAISLCWRAPEGSAGMEVTVIFAFNRKGEVFGKPRISHSKLFGDSSAQQAFVASALRAVSLCTPLSFSDSLGGAVAGRPFAMRFVGVPTQQKI